MIASIGEMILDILQEDETHLVAGGAPYNLIRRYTHLGNKGIFCSVVGKDSEGDFLRQDIEKHENILPYIMIHPKKKTGVSKVFIDKNGERSFRLELHRTYEVFPSLPESIYETCSVFHFSSLPLTSKIGQKKMLEEMKKLEKMQKKISFDVNLRPALFSSVEEMKNRYESILPHVDLLKVSEEENQILNLSSHLLKKDCLFFLTKGKDGADLFYQKEKITLPSLSCPLKNTLGAGDAFFGATLYQYEIFKDDVFHHLKDILLFAIASGSYAVSHSPHQYPSKEELWRFIKETNYPY